MAGVAFQTLIAELQCIGKFPAAGGNASQTEVAAGLGVAAPDGAEKVFIGSIQILGLLISTGADQTGEAALRVLIPAMGATQGIVGKGDATGEVGAVIFARRQRQVAAVVQWVEFQPALIVVWRAVAGMVVLLKMLTNKPSLFRGLNLVSGKWRFGRFRQRRFLRLMLKIMQNFATMFRQQADFKPPAELPLQAGMQHFARLQSHYFIHQNLLITARGD